MVVNDTDNGNTSTVQQLELENSVGWFVGRQSGTLQPRRPVSYTHLRAHETPEHLVCRLLLEKKKKNKKKKKKKFFFFFFNDTATTEIYT